LEKKNKKKKKRSGSEENRSSGKRKERIVGIQGTTVSYKLPGAKKRWGQITQK
jgi:hypothetical protein